MKKKNQLAFELLQVIQKIKHPFVKKWQVKEIGKTKLIDNDIILNNYFSFISNGYLTVSLYSMPFTSQKEFEAHIRQLVNQHITNDNPDIFALINKKAVNIVICKKGYIPHMYFIEAKIHIDSHGQLGLGNSKGKAFSLKYY